MTEDNEQNQHPAAEMNTAVTEVEYRLTALETVRDILYSIEEYETLTVDCPERDGMLYISLVQDHPSEQMEQLTKLDALMRTEVTFDFNDELWKLTTRLEYL